MEQSMDIHIHSHIDVLAYRALALAYLRRCKEAQEDLNEIDRLIEVLNDDARTRYWNIQKQEIRERCEK